MANVILIEVQDQFGAWHKYSSVANNPSSIKLGLQTALKAQLAQKSKKARAVDDKTGTVVDFAFG